MKAHVMGSHLVQKLDPNAWDFFSLQPSEVYNKSTTINHFLGHILLNKTFIFWKIRILLEKWRLVKKKIIEKLDF